MDATERGLCQHCGGWARWDGVRWRHEQTKLASCPNGRTSATADRIGEVLDGALSSQDRDGGVVGETDRERPGATRNSRDVSAGQSG